MNTLELLKGIADALVEQFGKNCEIVIHEIASKTLDSSVIYIRNGEVSHRKVGDGPSHVVLETLKKDPSQLKNKYGYLTKTKDGTILKSSTLYIKDEAGKVKYIFSINYNINGLILAEDILKTIINNNDSDDKKDPEKITQNVTELLDDLIDESVALIGKPVALMSKDEKIKAIQFLNDAGAFLITKSGDKVAGYFGISKYTLYNYIDVNKNLDI